MDAEYVVIPRSETSYGVIGRDEKALKAAGWTMQEMDRVVG
jgi:hypothetical protein